MKKNLIVGQSGGPTAVINASLYGVISEAFKHNESIETVYAMENGIEGFIHNKILNLNTMKDTRELELIKTTPGSYLGSCRYKLPENLQDEIYPLIFDQLEKYNIAYFLYIGGNDSMDTVSKLSKYAEMIHSTICFIGIPKTIDNDLCLTDHTPGFGSAAKYVATTVREISVDASVYDTKKSVTIVEIMGRHAGWLTGASVLARKFEGDNPTMIYLPEVAFIEDQFIEKLKEQLEHTPNLVVCVSEGINDGKGTFICELGAKVGVDNFGHKMLAGSGKYLENLVKERLNIKVRSIELNVNQRCSSTLLSLTDHLEAKEAGSFGVNAALDHKTGVMISFKREEHDSYKIKLVTQDVNLICNQEKVVPRSFINDAGDDITLDFINYASPLIQGELSPPNLNGLPEFAYRK